MDAKQEAKQEAKQAPARPAWDEDLVGPGPVIEPPPPRRRFVVFNSRPPPEYRNMTTLNDKETCHSCRRVWWGEPLEVFPTASGHDHRFCGRTCWTTFLRTARMNLEAEEMIERLYRLRDYQPFY